jgi:hypothetical protein
MTDQMSRFTGRQHKGAMAVLRAVKRQEAEERNERANPQRHMCGHVSSRADHPCEVTLPTPGWIHHKGWRG